MQHIIDRFGMHTWIAMLIPQTFAAVSHSIPCAACGGDQQVWPWIDLEDVGFCFDCQERAQPAVSEDELGGSE